MHMRNFKKILTCFIICFFTADSPVLAGGGSWKVKISNLKIHSANNATIVFDVLDANFASSGINPFYLKNKCSKLLVNIEYDPVTSTQKMVMMNQHELALSSLQTAQKKDALISFGVMADALSRKRSSMLSRTKDTTDVPTKCRFNARTISIVKEGNRKSVVYAF
jgi:hypothetical protein